MADFSLDTAVRGDAGRYRATLSPEWEVWGPLGGYVAALALRAMGAESPLRRPASFSCLFLSVAHFGSVELEQALTPKWSLVAFSDNLGFARRLDHYPFDTGLFSVGGGLRWRTLIGPIRLEYGYNLNPRPLDPKGTLQFSLGFPF